MQPTTLTRTVHGLRHRSRHLVTFKGSCPICVVVAACDASDTVSLAAVVPASGGHTWRRLARWDIGEDVETRAASSRLRTATAMASLAALVSRHRGMRPFPSIGPLEARDPFGRIAHA